MIYTIDILCASETGTFDGGNSRKGKMNEKLERAGAEWTKTQRQIEINKENTTVRQREEKKRSPAKDRRKLLPSKVVMRIMTRNGQPLQ